MIFSAIVSVDISFFWVVSYLMIFSAGFFLLQPGLPEVRWPWLEWGILSVVAFGVAWCMTDVAQA